ncbi:50S ribosomal protein L13 [Candidatus Gracilibacteria bacterium]|jgi:large subunit ribosomal protein L13|nr:50S ribosomal protein L13 [Candidatus Gracilibacteria bacterium]
MKTTIVKKVDIQRKWYIIDAKDQILGKIATKVADKLRGKDKPIFSPHMDCGDFVIITNVDKVKLTGKKLTDKTYDRHTGYPGGLISPNAKTVLSGKNPERVVIAAVRGMLPKNNLRDEMMRKLKLFTGTEHGHEAQQPEVLEI